MGIVIIKEQGWTEVVIDSNCDFNKFYALVEILKKDFGIHFSSEMDGLDTLYWDFKFKGSKLSLHYNIYAGISIIPTTFKNATFEDNENVIVIGKLLSEKIESKN